MSPPPTSDAGSNDSLELLWERVSQSARSGIVSDELIDALMRASIEYAGAERGVLVLARREEYWIEAEARSAGGNVSVNLGKTRVTGVALPESVIVHAIRTKDNVLLQDAAD